ncbi:MAG TPA: hypothetical protein VFT43_15045 [Candidatus Polarisedimenticolia bacterium]|nr:hypothetical protein [Candidatus Polarisedimenticolia bacterium]
MKRRPQYLDLVTRIAVILTIGAGMAAAIRPAGAQVTDRKFPAIYRLDKGSTYQTGCFDPCLCPVLVQTPVRGTFILTPAGSDPLFTYYNVSEVNWTVALGDPELRITGSGRYKIGGEFALQQELTLALQIGDQPLQKFDSGLVTGSVVPFPQIALTVSMNNMVCNDTVLVLNASPVPLDQIHPYRLARGSTFQRGCFGVCECVLGPKLPLAGDFTLVDLDSNWLWTEFAVVNVRWAALSSTSGTLTPIPIRGAGLYRYGGDFALQQRLGLNLLVGTDPLTHYDSGLQLGGGTFPRIDSRISINGEVCYDTVMEVHAGPRRIPRRGVRTAE